MIKIIKKRIKANESTILQRPKAKQSKNQRLTNHYLFEQMTIGMLDIVISFQSDDVGDDDEDNHDEDVYDLFCFPISICGY